MVEGKSDKLMYKGQECRLFKPANRGQTFGFTKKYLSLGFSERAIHSFLSGISRNHASAWIFDKLNSSDETMPIFMGQV